MASILLLTAAQCLPVMWMNAPTYDAYAHVPAGYEYLVYHDFHVYRHNPPLIQMVLGLPLIGLRPELPPPETARDLNRWEYAHAFHLLNREGYDRIFFWARVPVLLLSLSLLLLLWRWARRWYGPPGGLIGLSLLAFNPFYLAHSQVATVDVGAALAACLVFYTLARFLHEKRGRIFAGLALCLGLAQTAKFSSILLFIAVPLLLFLDLYRPGLASPPGAAPPRERGGPGAKLARLALRFLLLGAAALLVINLVFGFQGIFTPLKDFQFLSKTLRSVQETSGLGDWPMPVPYEYLAGLDAQNYLNHHGFANYVLGQRSQEGFWYYFLVAFSAKMPLGYLALLLLAVPAWFLAHRRRRDGRWLFLILPSLVFILYFSLMITVQCGLRYLLPVIPLLTLFAAYGGSRLWASGKAGKAAVLAATAANLFACATIFPDYLAFFNRAWGGPQHGYKVVVATDLDWGQDLKRCRDDLSRLDPLPEEIQADLFGKMDPALYGIPGAREMKKFPCPGWKLISIQLLINAFSPVPDRGWLAAFEPVKRYGYTLLLYHVTEEDLARVYTKDQLRSFELANRADGLVETDPVQAEALALEAIRLNPAAWQIHNFLGQFYFNRKEYAKAEKELKLALRLNPKEKRIYVLLGRDDRAE